MKIKKPTAARKELWATRLWATCLISALMTVLAPVSTLSSPPIDEARAEELPPANYQEYAADIALKQYGWNVTQLKCVDAIWTKESHWNPKADNPNSTAYGIAQMLNEDSRDGYEQIRNGLRYIEHRYSTPCKAWEFWKRNYWY
jgi:hypothetical protein